MNRSETQLSNPTLLHQYISTIERQLAARKKENEEMQKYFEQSLTFIQQTNEASEKLREQNRRYKGVFDDMDRKVKQLYEEKKGLQRLLVDVKNQVESVKMENQIWKENAAEKEKQIQELTRVNDLLRREGFLNVRINQQMPKELKLSIQTLYQNDQPFLQKQKPVSFEQSIPLVKEDPLNMLLTQKINLKEKQILKLTKEGEILRDKIIEIQSLFTNLKEQFKNKEAFFINLQERKQIQANYLAQKAKNTQLSSEIQRKTQILTLMTQQTYKANLAALSETIEHQKATIVDLTQQLLYKQREIQTLQNSNSTLRKLKIAWISQESFDSLYHANDKMAHTKGQPFSLLTMQDLQSEQFDKMRSGKTVASLNLNQRKSRKFLKRLSPFKQNKNTFEESSIPTSAQDRKALQNK